MINFPFISTSIGRKVGKETSCSLQSKVLCKDGSGRRKKGRCSLENDEGRGRPIGSYNCNLRYIFTHRRKTQLLFYRRKNAYQHRHKPWGNFRFIRKITMCVEKFLAWLLQKVQKYFVCKLVFNFCLTIDTAPANTPLWIIADTTFTAIYFRSNLQYSKQYKNDYHQKYRRENKPDNDFSCKWRKLSDAYFTLVRLATQVFVKAFYAVIIKVHNFIFCFSFFSFQCAPRSKCCKPDVTLQKLLNDMSKK